MIFCLSSILFYIFTLIVVLFYRQNSHMQQSARLRLLKAREDHIRGIIEEARQKLVDVTKDTNMYSKVLQKLIAQVISNNLNIFQ